MQPETLADQAFYAIAPYGTRNNAFTDSQTEARVAHFIWLGVNCKPIFGLSPLLQYPRKTFPARQSIAPRKCQNLLWLTRQDARGPLRDEQQ